jgi:VanZ family protein
MIKKNIFSILVALLLLYLSLANSEKFENISLFKISYLDKIVHFGMYFTLMSVIIIEHRKSIKDYRYLFLWALIPLLYGILMEILQLTLTVSRSGNFFDAMFNAAGIFVSILFFILVKSIRKKSSDNYKI